MDDYESPRIDPELKTSRLYTDLSAAEGREALLAKGYNENQQPCERTILHILNRMKYRLKRIQKGKPLKKAKDTNAIFNNVRPVRTKYGDDRETLKISVDTKVKVILGEHALGVKRQGPTAKAKSPKGGIMIRRPKMNWCRSES